MAAGVEAAAGVEPAGVEAAAGAEPVEVVAEATVVRVMEAAKVTEPVLVTATETRTTLFQPMVRDPSPPGTKERVIMGMRTAAQAIWQLRTMAAHVT
jgi:hypothetical protein